MRDIYLAWRKCEMYTVLLGKPERKRALGRLRCGWKGNIEFDLEEMVV
jgi:hypothetical protein